MDIVPPHHQQRGRRRGYCLESMKHKDHKFNGRYEHFASLQRVWPLEVPLFQFWKVFAHYSKSADTLSLKSPFLEYSFDKGCPHWGPEAL